jgi:hypothetical protein
MLRTNVIVDAPGRRGRVGQLPGTTAALVELDSEQYETYDAPTLSLLVRYFCEHCGAIKTDASTTTERTLYSSLAQHTKGIDPEYFHRMLNYWLTRHLLLLESPPNDHAALTLTTTNDERYQLHLLTRHNYNPYSALHDLMFAKPIPGKKAKRAAYPLLGEAMAFRHLPGPVLNMFEENKLAGFVTPTTTPACRPLMRVVDASTIIVAIRLFTMPEKILTGHIKLLEMNGHALQLLALLTYYGQSILLGARIRKEEKDLIIREMCCVCANLLGYPGDPKVIATLAGWIANHKLVKTTYKLGGHVRLRILPNEDETHCALIGNADYNYTNVFSLLTANGLNDAEHPEPKWSGTEQVEAFKEELEREDKKYDLNDAEHPEPERSDSK